MKRAWAVLLVGLIGAVAGWLAHHYAVRTGLITAAPTGSPSAADPPDHGTDVRRGEVNALGRLQPAGGVIDILAPMGDGLKRLMVAQGKTVKSGDRLAVLESQRLRGLDLEAAQSQLKEARARYAAEERLADARIAGAKLAVEQAKAQRWSVTAQRKKIDFLTESLALAEEDRSRLQGLSKDLVSDQQRARQQLVVDQAEAELAAARALLQQMLVANRHALEGASAEAEAAEATKEQVLAAIPVKSLEIRCRQAELRNRQARIKAPCDGTVLKVLTREGERIGAGPILQLADLSQIVVVAEVYEADVRRIRRGQKAEIRSRALALPGKQKCLVGEVDLIGKMISAPGLKAVDPFAPADLHVVEVRIKLDAENSRWGADFVNLQVDVKFLPDAS